MLAVDPQPPRGHPVHRFLIPLLISAMSLGLVMLSTAHADDDAELQRIDELIHEGRADEALQRVEALLASPELEPRNLWRARQRLGAALVAVGRPEDAVALLEAVIREVDDEATPRLNLARALVALGQPGRAVAEFQRALQLDPRHVEGYLEYGDALLSLGARREALRQIQAARELCGDCSQALRAEANLHLVAGRQDEAVAPLRALLVRGGGPEVRKLLVAALWNTGRAEAAAALLDTLSGEALSADEMLVVAQLERQRGRAGRARLWLDDPPRDLPAGWRPPARFWALASEACLAEDLPQLALAAVDRALERRPDVAVYHHNRAAILLQLGRQDEARQALDEARRLDPSLGGGP